MKPSLWWIKQPIFIQGWWLLFLAVCKCFVVSLMHWVLKRGSFIWCGCSGKTQCFDINYVIKFSHTADRNIIRSKRSLLCTPGCQACLRAWEHVSAYSLYSRETISTSSSLLVLEVDFTDLFYPFTRSTQTTLFFLRVIIKCVPHL